MLKNLKWRQFIASLLEISIDACSQNNTLICSCDLNNLYNNYLLHLNDISIGDCLSSMTFDKYLLLKIAKLPEWHTCNYHDVFAASGSEWCQAWRRIMKSKFNDTVSNFVKPNKRREKWSQSYMQDVQTILRWLSTTIKSEYCQKAENNFIELPKINPYDIADGTGSAVDIGLCYLTTLVVNLLTWENHCKKFSSPSG